MKKLSIKASIQIQRPIGEVYEAIVDPAKMTGYFISESTGRMETGRELIWKWPEFPNDPCPVNHIRAEKNRSVSFVWDSDTIVRIDLEEQADGSVVVQVTEGEKDATDENLLWYSGNAGGWANFLACLKAYVEYGINLRKGAFEFMRKQQ